MRNNAGITTGKMVMFDPEQGPNVSYCDRLIKPCESLDVVRSGANQYNLFSMMPSTLLVTSMPISEHPVLTTHGGSKDCAGDMKEFQKMMMERSSGEIFTHLHDEGVKINRQAMSQHRLHDSLEPRDVDHPVTMLSEESRRMGYQMFNSTARMGYAKGAVDQVNEAMLAAISTLEVAKPPIINAPSFSDRKLR